MAEIKTEQEPSIEEILESIRQIISEDGTPVDAAVAAAKPAKQAEAIPAPVPPKPKPQPQQAAPKPAAPPPVPVRAQPILDLTEKVEPVKETPRIALEEHEEEDHLVSDLTADAAVESLARLLANNMSVERELPGRPGNVTLEDMTREILRPLLKEWLAEHLQGIIEKMVAREIERLSLRALEK